jgi:hypothetical protein
MFLIVPVLWFANKQSTIAVSTAEAENVALSPESNLAEALLQSSWNLPMKESSIYVDRRSCFKIANNDVAEAQTKKYQFLFHLSRQAVLSVQTHCFTVLLNSC